MTTRSYRRIMTGASAFVLACTTPMVVPSVIVPAAIAQPISSTITQDKGSLTIHKFTGAPTNTEATGEALDTEPNAPANAPLPGVTFAVTRLTKLDITKSSDWKIVNNNKDADPEEFAKTQEPGTVVEATTEDNGIAKLTDLDVGFYLVKEVSSPNGYLPAKPFIVALPMTKSNGSEWNYDVNVYPKNNKFETEKKVRDEGRNTGDWIEYRVETDIPAVSGEQIEVMKISDLLDKALKVEKKDITFTIVSDGDDEDITSDFTVSIGAVENRSHIYAEATLEARKKLAAAKRKNAEAKLWMSVRPTIKDDLGGVDGEIVNDAYVWVNDPSQKEATVPAPTVVGSAGNEDDPGSTNSVVTKIGTVTVTKKNPSGTSNDQKGAQFQIYRCTSNEPVDSFPAAPGKPGTTIGAPLTVGSKDTFEAGTGGVLNIVGLHAQDYVNDADVPTDAAPLVGNNAEGYCLVETKAPTGYERLPEPIFFQVQGENATTPLAFDISDPNKNAGFQLPLTGARGVIFFALLGGGLLLLAAFVSRRNKKTAE